MVDPQALAIGALAFLDALVGLTVHEHRELTIIRTILDVWLSSATNNVGTNGRFALARTTGDAFAGSVMPDPLSDDTDYLVNQAFFVDSATPTDMQHFHMDLKGRRANQQDDWMLPFIIEVHSSADGAVTFYVATRTLLMRR